MQLTGGQEFYYRLSAAREAQDLVSLGALYDPDAVFLSVSTGQVFRGRGAILDSFKHAFGLAGAVSSRSVESLVEVGGAVCVEATLATRFAQMQTYDVYLLQAGVVKCHIGGLIAPRPASGQGCGQGLPQTRGGAFYHRWYAAIEAQDFATLESLYHSGAVRVNCSVNEAASGRDAIMDSLRQFAQNGGRVTLKTIEKFVETEEIVCAEVASTTVIGGAPFDTLAYDIFVLHADRVALYFSGLISPRWPELQQAIQQQMGQRMDRDRMVMQAFQDSLYPRRWW
jgi:ketosteroid isomerase-like protein